MKEQLRLVLTRVLPVFRPLSIGHRRCGSTASNRSEKPKKYLTHNNTNESQQTVKLQKSNNTHTAGFYEPTGNCTVAVTKPWMCYSKMYLLSEMQYCFIFRYIGL